MIEIQKFLGLTADNQVKNLEFIQKLSNLHKIYSIDQVEYFYNAYQQKDIKIICMNQNIPSLTEIMYHFPQYDSILNKNENFNLQMCTDTQHISDSEEEMSLDDFLKQVTKQSDIDSIIMYINNYYDDDRVHVLYDYIPENHTNINKINLNRYTFPHLITKMCIDCVPLLMTYVINSYEEYCMLIDLLDNECLFNEISKYIKLQNIINNTIFYCAVKIFDNFSVFTNVCNLDMKKIVLYCDKDDILGVNNDIFKEFLLKYSLEIKFDLEMFVFAINENTNLKYSALKLVENHDFTNQEIYLIYFEKKYRMSTKYAHIKDILKEIINNKLYNVNLLKNIVKNKIDFGLFTEKEIEILRKEVDVYEYVVPKYFRKIIEMELGLENVLFEKYKVLYTFLKTKKEPENLPIVKNYAGFHMHEIEEITLIYCKKYDINYFVHVLIERKIEAERISAFIEKNYSKIRNQLEKLTIMINYNLISEEETYIDEIMLKLHKNEKQKLIASINSFKSIEKYFYTECTANLIPNKEITQMFYSSIESKLDFIDKIYTTKLDNTFLFNFFTLLFADNYEPLHVSKRINNILSSFTYNKTIMYICADYYFNTILRNEFFQEETLLHVRDFLNILYIFLESNGRNMKIYKYCEGIIARIKYFSVFFDCDLVLKNIKKISY